MTLMENAPTLWLSHLPWPRPEGHKYDRGHAALLSGPAGATGAIRLAARGALRIGAGLVTVHCLADAAAEHAAQLNAVMLKSAADETAQLSALAADARVSAICIGPGFGRERARRILPALLALDRPTVLDADALHALPRAFPQREAPAVLTPHDGEFAAAFPDIALDDRAKAAQSAAASVASVVVLKGSRSVIAAPDGRVAENPPALPFLATAGSGDVLSGFVAGLLAQGMPAFEAACAAVALHAQCAERIGPGLISEDLPDALPAVLADLYAASAGQG